MKSNFIRLLGIFFILINHVSAQEAPNLWDVLRNEFSINHEVMRPEVQEQIRWLAAHPGYLNKVSQQAKPYIYHITTQIKKRRLPGELALLPMIESAYDPFAYSRAGAAGLWQIMPKTGSELGLKQDWWFDGRRSIGASTDAALSYLVYLNNKFHGDWGLAFAAYDAGEGTISNAIKLLGSEASAYFWDLTLPQETRIYVPRLLALAELISNPERYRINLPSIPYLPYFEEVNIGSQIDLSHAAQMAGISYKELIKLNPGYNRWTTAPYSPFKLLIPSEKVALFNVNLSNVSEEKRISWSKNRIQNIRNSTKNSIHYHTTANLIKKVNQLSPYTPAPKVNTQALPLLKSIATPRNHRMIHIVQSYDTYQRLEKIYHTSKKEIQAWNKLAPSENLRPGQQLLIWKKITT